MNASGQEFIPRFPYQRQREGAMAPRASWFAPGEMAKTYAMIDGLIHSRHRQGNRLDQYEPTAQLAYLIGWTEGEKTRRP